MEAKEFAKKVSDLFCEVAIERYKEEGLPAERIAILTKKFKVLQEQAILEDELDSYTHNRYQGITEILVALYEEQNKLLKDCAAKCKKYLDDNNLPYEEEEEEED